MVPQVLLTGPHRQPLQTYLKQVCEPRVIHGVLTCTPNQYLVAGQNWAIRMTGSALWVGHATFAYNQEPEHLPNEPSDRHENEMTPGTLRKPNQDEQD